MTQPVPETSVLVERHGPVQIVTINRPDSRNAVDRAVTDGIGQALADADADPEIRVVILTGSGDKAFCAGVDLKAVARGESVMPEDPDRAAWGFAGYVSHLVDVVTIAAVNGVALGGGTELMLASDLAVAADHATFGLPEVRRGIMAAAGGAFRLVQQLPRKVGMELLLTGDAISAQQAFEYGLVNRVVPLADLLPTALELANRIAANAPLSIRASKRVAYGVVDGRIPADDVAWQINADEAATVMASADAVEGPTAFAEKREPRWQGR